MWRLERCCAAVSWSSDAVKAPRGAWVSWLAVCSCWLDVRRQDCRVERTGGGWQREDACFELSRLQGIERDRQTADWMKVSGVVWCVWCVCGRGQEQRGRQAELGTWPWMESGVGGMARGRGLAPRPGPGFWCSWCRIGARARARRLPQPPGSCRICRLQVDSLCCVACVCARLSV